MKISLVCLLHKEMFCLKKHTWNNFQVEFIVWFVFWKFWLDFGDPFVPQHGGCVGGDPPKWSMLVCKALSSGWVVRLVKNLLCSTLKLHFCVAVFLEAPVICLYARGAGSIPVKTFVNGASCFLVSEIEALQIQHILLKICLEIEMLFIRLAAVIKSKSKINICLLGLWQNKRQIESPCRYSSCPRGSQKLLSDLLLFDWTVN